MSANISKTDKKRIIIIGGGFGGLKLARELSKSDYQIILFDKNNYNQFQPLLYQVATAGLEPSAISFPFRKIFHKAIDVHIRIAEVSEINADKNQINTSIGLVNYDYLIIAIGTDTNFFGNDKLKEKAKPMKSIIEALSLRNTILQNYEDALAAEDIDTRNRLMNIVVVGAGPTGVEVSGALAEMKKYVLPKDYPELDFKILTDRDGKEIYEGMLIDYTVKPLFGVPLHWKTEICKIEKPGLFTDRQLKGPYKI